MKFYTTIPAALLLALAGAGLVASPAMLRAQTTTAPPPVEAPAADDAEEAEDAGDTEEAKDKAPDAAPETAAEAPATTTAMPPPLPAPGPPPLPPQPALPPYFAGIGGQPVGPLDEAALRTRIAAGEITGATMVWTDGMADWQPASEITELAPLLAPADSVADTATGNADSKAAPDAPALDAAFLTGSWSAKGPMLIEGTTPGQADMTMRYGADNSFELRGTVSTVLPALGPTPVDLTMTATGRWALTALAEDRATVSLNGETTITLPGLPPQNMPVDERTLLVRLDANSMRDNEGLVWTRQ